LEGDVKLTQEAVADLDRVVTELSQTVQRKEKELASVGAKIEDEQTLGGKFTKQIKELQTRIEELDEELAIERQNRALRVGQHCPGILKIWLKSLKMLAIILPHKLS
jgi:myosin heavy chain 6/7